tara:strand:- start:69949 stop:72753 length:2805 start_codon:yes stop_codon:yes gene_type:complete
MKTLILSLILLTSTAWSFVINDLDVNCSGSVDCSIVETSFKSLRRKYTGVEHFQKTIKLYVLNKGVNYFNYQVVKRENLNRLIINLELKKEVGDIIIKNADDIDIPTVLPIAIGDYENQQKIENTASLLQSVAVSRGYSSAYVKTKRRLEDNEVVLEFTIKKGKPTRLDRFDVVSKSAFLRTMMSNSLKQYVNKNFDIQEIKNKVEELKQLFIIYGYYLVDLEVISEKVGSHKMFIKVVINNTQLFNFHFIKKSEIFNKKELKDQLKEMIVSYKRPLTVENIKEKVRTLYAKYGYDNLDLAIKELKYKNINKDNVTLYRIKYDINKRREIGEIQFRGVTPQSEKKLRRLFYENAPSVVKSGYYEPQYVNSFKELVKDYYIKKGYLGVFVESPKFNYKDESIIISYRVKEGIRSIVDGITFTGIPQNISDEIKKELQTKSKKPFDPTIFKQDIETVENFLFDQGFYNAEILNKNASNIVDYRKDSSTVNIKFEISLNKRLYVDKIIIVGNRKTRSKLIRREISIKESDIITKQKIQESQTNLLGLGLFSNVVIKPVQNINNYADILIIVREKNFGLIEVAPGVRTDIGFKVSTDVSYNNIDGLNKRLSFKGQVNQRFNLNSLDDQRRENSNSLIEYNLIANYSENYLFDSDVRFSTSLSRSRQRFFSFDADISRVNFTFSYAFTKWFSSSIRYQFETIEQFEATQEIDEGTFQIGSLTPAITLDFRDNRINPTKGAWFNLSYEAANPSFFSQSNDELIINYFKLVSRNRFYMPITNGVLAVSVAAGLQQNMARDKRTLEDGSIETEGFIPNIKVFRLNGVDIVRGYEDNEINMIKTGEDISEARVDNRAYMAVLKVEPRFFINDSSMFGVFYDAGRVFVGDYDTSDLKSSVGFTFKYLTPVGTLDFDYGIKLLRKNDDGDKFDSPGRLHVSIGFF